MTNAIFVFLISILGIYFVSQITLNELYNFLHTVFRNKKISFVIISLLFLPGTLLHEISHYFVAVVLFLRVREVNIFPQFQDNHIKLGSVLYEKKDAMRSVLVGIAPFFAGLFFFGFLSIFKLFPQSNIVMNILFGYLIFAVSSTMFSSKQDLQDLLYIIPFIFLITGAIYVFNINVEFISNQSFLIKSFQQIDKTITPFLFISFIIHIVLVFVFKNLRNFFRQ